MGGTETKALPGHGPGQGWEFWNRTYAWVTGGTVGGATGTDWAGVAVAAGAGGAAWAAGVAGAAGA